MTENEQRPQVEIDALRAESAALRAQVEELLGRLNRNSSNSSRPPSSDPPWRVKLGAAAALHMIQKPYQIEAAAREN